MPYRIGIDTGGTFTDVVAVDEVSGEMLTTKTPSTPGDPSHALLEGARKVLAGNPAQPSGIYHGTTVATNALLEERFASLGLITTKGFRHILEIARQSVPSGYGNSYFWVKPDRMVPLHFVKEVSERLNFKGEVIREFDEEGARHVARWFRQQGIQSIGICFIHAYANGKHERRMAEILEEEYPEASISLSSQVLPEYREYERTVATLVDAFVKPAVKAYVQQAARNVEILQDGIPLPFLIMQSNGGVLSAHDVAERPIATLLSGPAAGVLGATWLAGAAGYRDILTVDAGGTSTDICMVESGSPHITTEGTLGRFTVKVPMIDISTIGTGGGSIAWVDRSGGLRVGPKSAGADPGPLCYGKGGEDVTLSDANLVLARLPGRLLDGEMSLDVERAKWGMANLSERLGLEPIRLAAGIIEIADWNQVNAIRQVTVKRGIDPRRFAMVAFGGSGPLQASRVAQLLDLQTVIIPPNPGNISALGLLAVDLKTDYVATAVQREDKLDPEALERIFLSLQDGANQQLAGEGVPMERRRLVRTIDVRYFGQAYELRIDTPAETLTLDVLGDVIDRFHHEHEKLYGYSYQGSQTIEIVNVRVTGVGLIDQPPIRTVPSNRPVTSGEGRSVYFGDDFVACDVVRREKLGEGWQANGPIIVEEYGSTTVVQPEHVAKMDRLGNLILSPAEQPGS